MPRRFKFTEYDRIVLDGVAYRFVDSDEAVHRFEHAETPSRKIALTDLQVAAAAGRSGYRFDRGYFAESQALTRVKSEIEDLTSLRPFEIGRMTHRLSICEAFLDREARGLSTRSDASMAEALAIIFAEMVGLAAGDGTEKGGNRPKASDVLEIRKPPCAKTLRDWLRRLDEGDGSLASLRPRHFRAGDREPRFDDEVRAAIEECVDEYASETRPTLAACHDVLAIKIGKISTARALSPAEALPCPSISSLSRAVRLRGPFAVYAGRHGHEAAQRKFKPRGEGVEVTRAGERVELDEWQVKLQALLVEIGLWEGLSREERKALKRVRVWLCAAIDAASRCVLGMSLSHTASAANALAALGQVVRDKTALARAHGATTLWDQSCNPEEVFTDTGSSFRSDAFRTAVSGLRGWHVLLPAGQPKLRGRNERLFRTLHNRTFAWTPGRTFSNVVDRGRYDAVGNAAINLETLSTLLVRSVVDVYHHTPHDGLGGETPANAWRRLTAECAVVPLPGADQARDIFGTPLERRVGPHGVRVLNLDFSSDRLQEHWRSQHLGDVEVRLDPFDLGQVSVRVSSGWLTCPCRRDGFQGVSMGAWVDKQRDLARIHGVDAKLSRDVVLKAIEDMRALIQRDTRRFGLDELRVSAEQIERLERELKIGFALPSTTGAPQPRGDGDDLFADAVVGTGPGSPAWLERNGGIGTEAGSGEQSPEQEERGLGAHPLGGADAPTRPPRSAGSSEPTATGWPDDDDGEDEYYEVQDDD